jgi:hypothetical protein
MRHSSIGILISALLFCASYVHSQPSKTSVPYLGMQFPVENIQKLSSGEVVVKVFSASAVGKPGELGAYVAEQVFSKGSLISFSDAELLSFYKKLLRQKGDELLKRVASRKLFERWEKSESSMILMAGVFNSSDENRNFIHETFDCDWIAGRETALFFFLSSVPRTLSSPVIQQTFLCGSGVQGFVQGLNRSIQYYFQTGDLGGGLRATKLGITRYGSGGDPAQRVSFHRLLKDLRLTFAADGGRKYWGRTLLNKMSLRLWRAQAQRQAAYHYLIRRVSKGIRKLAEHKAIAALLAWESIPNQALTYSMVKGIQTTLLKLNGRQLKGYLRPERLPFVLWVAGLDKAFHQDLCSLLEDEIKASRNFTDSKGLFELLGLLRTGAQGDNDQVLVDAALNALSRGETLHAHSFLNEIVRPLSKQNLFALGLRGYFMPIWLILLVITMPLIIGVAIFATTRKRNFGQSRRPVSGYSDEVDTEDQEMPTFVGGVPRVDPRIRELQRLFEDFGVLANADFRDVKSAYKRKIKALHPDHGAPQTATTQKEFQMVQESYNRIIELRQELGMED